MKIKDFTFGSECIGLVVRLSDVHLKKTTSGNDYASMLAYDGEEVIEAKIWTFTDLIKGILQDFKTFFVALCVFCFNFSPATFRHPR